MINVRLPWPPTANTYYRSVSGRNIISKKGRSYKEQCALELMVQRAKKGLTSRLEVSVDAYPPDNRKRDLDNLFKPLLDAIQDYGMFRDDQIDILRIRRMDKGGYVRVMISEIDE